MRADMSRRFLRSACHAGVLLGLLLLALPGRAEAQGIGLTHLLEMMDWGRETYVLAEVLEFAPDGIDRPVRYDLLGWAGGASNRIWAKADGEHGTQAGGGETELQLLYGRLLTPWWDGQVGVKVDAHYGEGSTSTRTSLALGVQGLAPGWFEVEPTLFVSQYGDVSASLEASYDLLFTQRLVLAPRVELNASARRVPEFGIGSGLSDLELGGRMRYELHRKFAPYIGVNWHRRLGGTADFARDDGEPVSVTSLVAGVRTWY